MLFDLLESQLIKKSKLTYQKTQGTILPWWEMFLVFVKEDSEGEPKVQSVLFFIICIVSISSSLILFGLLRFVARCPRVNSSYLPTLHKPGMICLWNLAEWMPVWCL